jgi:hypothetical protein
MNFIEKIRGYNALAKESEDLRNKISNLSRELKIASLTAHKAQTGVRWFKNHMKRITLKQVDKPVNLNLGPYDCGALYTLKNIIDSTTEVSRFRALAGVRGANVNPKSEPLNVLTRIDLGEPISNSKDFILFLDSDLDLFEVVEKGKLILLPGIDHLIAVARWAQVVRGDVGLVDKPEAFDMLLGTLIEPKHRNASLTYAWGKFRTHWGLEGAQLRHFNKVVRRVTGATGLQLFTAMYCNVNATKDLLVK